MVRNLRSNIIVGFIFSELNLCYVVHLNFFSLAALFNIEFDGELF